MSKTVMFNGRKKEFAQVLADWIAKDARQWKTPDGPEAPSVVPEGHYAKRFGELGMNAEDLHRALQSMVGNRHAWETLVAFAARYKSAVLSSSASDMQEALDIIAVAEVQGS